MPRLPRNLNLVATWHKMFLKMVGTPVSRVRYNAEAPEEAQLRQVHRAKEEIIMLSTLLPHLCVLCHHLHGKQPSQARQLDVLLRTGELRRCTEKSGSYIWHLYGCFSCFSFRFANCTEINSNWSDKNDICGQLVDSSGFETSDPWCRWQMAHRPKPRKYSSQIGNPGHCAGGDITKQLQSSTPRVGI